MAKPRDLWMQQDRERIAMAGSETTKMAKQWDSYRIAMVGFETTKFEKQWDL